MIAGRGVAVELGDKVDVLYNAIYANDQDGIWVHQEAPLRLQGNSISSNHGHGVVTALTTSVSLLLLFVGWFTLVGLLLGFVICFSMVPPPLFQFHEKLITIC